MRVLQPVARLAVTALARTPVAPHMVVLAHTALGLMAAWLLAGDHHGRWLVAAALLQVKSVLDNVDGGLARATGRVTAMGRYLDTLMDLLVNAALFWALAQHGPASLSWLAFISLTLVLSAEFNAARRYLEVRGATAPDAPAGAPEAVMAPLRGAYDLILAPQDRLLRRLDERLFLRAAGAAWREAGDEARRRWADRFSVDSLVNLGLSTQLLALGLCAALGRPYAYVMLVLLQVPYVLSVQGWRVVRFRAGAA